MSPILWPSHRLCLCPTGVTLSYDLAALRKASSNPATPGTALVSEPATRQFRAGTISHEFASRREAEAYCSAAGQQNCQRRIEPGGPLGSGRSLPLLYLLGPDEAWRATAFLLKARAGGFFDRGPGIPGRGYKLLRCHLRGGRSKR